MNEQIRVPQVRVIDQNNEQIGIISTYDAQSMARDAGLDLVEVAPAGVPPVCRIMDFGKMKYERKKKDAAARKKQVTIVVKEIKLRPKTDQHDFDVKTRHARRFLEEGNKVKVTIRFRGRELAHRDIGVLQCNRVFEAVKDLAVVEQPARMEGRQMHMIIAPQRRG